MEGSWTHPETHKYSQRTSSAHIYRLQNVEGALAAYLIAGADFLQDAALGFLVTNGGHLAHQCLGTVWDWLRCLQAQQQTQSGPSRLRLLQTTYNMPQHAELKKGCKSINDSGPIHTTLCLLRYLYENWAEALDLSFGGTHSPITHCSRHVRSGMGL